MECMETFENTAKIKERKSNLLAGGLHYMSEDFDNTPDCFTEYITPSCLSESPGHPSQILPSQNIY